MRIAVTSEEYLKDPCRASSLPFWKSEQFEFPDDVFIYREDELDEKCGNDEPYFKMIHHLEKIDQPHMPDEYELIAAEPSEIAAHIRECYREETVTDEELLTYTQRSVYDKDLWIAIREKQTGKIIASGIGEFDETIGEGILEWIQVSPKYRRKGLGKVIVCELLKRLSEKAGFVTVSGRMNNPDDPFSLYKACGFEDPVIWHIVR